MKFLYILILFIIGMGCSAFLHAGNLRLSDGLLLAIAGILYLIWNKMDYDVSENAEGTLFFQTFVSNQKVSHKHVKGN